MVGATCGGAEYPLICVRVAAETSTGWCAMGWAATCVSGSPVGVVLLESPLDAMRHGRIRVEPQFGLEVRHCV